MSKTVSFAQAYSDVLGSGFVKDEILQKHVEEHGKIDKILPKSASFFYIIDLATSTYHFLGKQQQNISGIENEELLKLGIEGFLQRVHPEEIGILLNEVYQDFGIWLDEVKDEHSHIDIVFQYNYRFLNGHEKFINMMEHVHPLEVDRDGRTSLILGNVITVDDTQILPIRSSMKVYHKDEVIETLKSKTYGKKQLEQNITQREQDILRNLATGKTSKEIAEQLFISPHTVDTHRRNLLKKMECNSVVELAQIAFQNGLV